MRAKRKPISLRHTGLLAAALVVCLVLLAVSFHAVSGLYDSLNRVWSIYSVDVQALSIAGEIQYQTQENRQKSVQVLIPSLETADRLASIAAVREADLHVSLLTARIALLTGNREGLKLFSTAWDRYGDLRDTSIALALQHRFPAALAVEDAQGRRAFEAAAEELRGYKAALERSSEVKAANTLNAVRHAVIELCVLLLVALALVGGLLAMENLRRRAMATLRESETRLRNIFEEAAVAIITTDTSGTILSANKAISEISGYTPSEIVGMRVASLLSPDQREDSAEALAGLGRGDYRNYRAERRIVRKDGRHGWVRQSVSVVRKNGAPVEVIGLCEDITERKVAQEQLNYQASHDSLTGLTSRGPFEEALQRAIDDAAASDTAIALLYIDLDGFKFVNDTMGHPVGDFVLREVAGRMQKCLRRGEILGRIGGDEFTIVVPLHSAALRTGPLPPGPWRPGSNKPVELARRILEAIRAPLPEPAQSARVGASIGISHYPVDAADAGELCQTADAAMFHAKRHHAGIHVFDRSMKQALLRRLGIRKHLPAAIRDGELTACYQPLYDLPSGNLIRFEALCRWDSADLGSVPPDEFIPVAEECGLIREVGRRMLLDACEQAERWRSATGRPIQVAVNVSALQFSSPDFAEVVHEILARTKLPPHHLELELTESVLVRDHEASARKMETLRSTGVSISIDDFGTGYSSLSYLQSMPVDALKIDRSFTSRIDSSETAVTMIRSIIAMARTLGLRVVTEGVETRQQLDIVRQLGSDEAQGYFLGRPESAAAAMERVLAAEHCSVPA